MANKPKPLHKQATLYVDQYGNKIYARTVKDLIGLACGSKATKMYRDIGGVTHHCGYIVGDRWFDAYAMVLVPEA